MSADLWQRGCERSPSELPEQQFNTWIRPLARRPKSPTTATRRGGTVRVPNRFKLDWIRNQYAGRIEAVLSELAGKPVRLDVTLAPRDGAARPPTQCSAAVRRRPRGRAARRRRSSNGARRRRDGHRRRRRSPIARRRRRPPLPSRSRLNPR